MNLATNATATQRQSEPGTLPVSANRRLEFQALGLAMVLAAIVYGSYLSRAGFPLNDGGLFYAMIRDIQHAHYALSRFTSYNPDPSLPFAYPPLPFYVVAIFSGALHVNALAVIWVLPAVVTLLTVPVFFLLARRLGASGYALVVAVVAFALAPDTFSWRIMGGGLTRSFGFFFALLAVYWLHRLFVTGARSSVICSGVFAGLTVLSHLEAATFVALSAILLMAWHGRNRRAVVHALLAAAIAVLVASPWWLTVLHRFGAAPFVASLHSNAALAHGLFVWVLTFHVGREYLYPLIASLGLLGLVMSCVKRQLLLPVWLFAEVILDPRGGSEYAIVPLCLLAGIGVAEVLVPALARLMDKTSAARAMLDGREASAAGKRSTIAPVLVCLAVFYAVIGASVQQEPLITLSGQDRAAMQWVAENTPQTSAFLIVPVTLSSSATEEGWPTDRVSEWFPALAGRRSVATVQGREWLANFAETVSSYDRLSSCAERDTACLESWASQTGRPFGYVYLPKDASTSGSQCCWALSRSFASDPTYTLLYNGTSATI